MQKTRRDSKKDEIFINVKWEKLVTDPADGYWEKGMTRMIVLSDREKKGRLTKNYFGCRIKIVRYKKYFAETE